MITDNSGGTRSGCYFLVFAEEDIDFGGVYKDLTKKRTINKELHSVIQLKDHCVSLPSDSLFNIFLHFYCSFIT